MKAAFVGTVLFMVAYAWAMNPVGFFYAFAIITIVAYLTFIVYLILVLSKYIKMVDNHRTRKHYTTRKGY